MVARPKDAVLSRMTFEVMPEVCLLVADFEDEMEATDWLRRIMGRAWFTRRWKARYPLGFPIAELFPRGVRFASEASSQRCTVEVEERHQYMALDRGKQNPLEALHILAHGLQSGNGPWHGADFAQTYFDLVERTFGKEARRDVKNVFLKHKIKTRAVSEATREKRRDALLDRQAVSARDEAQEMLRELKQLERDHGRGR